MWGRSRYDDGYDRDGYDHSLLLLFGRCYVLLLRATAGLEETPVASNTHSTAGALLPTNKHKHEHLRLDQP